MKIKKSVMLGAREMVELRAAILGGERSAAAIAFEIGCSSRTVQRERLRLRSEGLRVPDYTPDAVGREDAAEAERDKQGRIIRKARAI